METSETKKTEEEINLTVQNDNSEGLEAKQ